MLLVAATKVVPLMCRYSLTLTCITDELVPAQRMPPSINLFACAVTSTVPNAVQLCDAREPIMQVRQPQMSVC